MKGSRRKAREEALQILFQLDMNLTLSTENAVENFERLYAKDAGKVDEFGRRLVLGVMEKLAEIDLKIKNCSEHWRMDRMPSVDKNILRLGSYELLYCEDIPATVTINEMIEIGKEFGSEGTPAFVNGILDKIKTFIDLPNKAK